MGAVIQTLSGPKLMEILSGGQVREPDWQTMEASLMQFISAGLRAGVRK
jgi:hypothetical protein